MAHRSASPPPPTPGSHFTTFTLCGSGTATGGQTFSLAETGPEPEPEPEPEAGGEEGESEPKEVVEVGWLVAADSEHFMHVWRIDTWEKMFCWCSLSFVDKGLGRHPITCLTPLGAVVRSHTDYAAVTGGDTVFSSEEDYECVLAMDDVVEGGIVLWDLAALCLRWRATGESGFVADDSVICRTQPILDNFVTSLSRVGGEGLQNDYLVCGSNDGKCKVTLVGSGDLVGQLVTEGDDAWGFMDREPGVTVPTPDVEDDESDDEAAARQTEEIFAELEGDSPFYSLMVQSTDLTKRVQPEYEKQLERMTKDPTVKAHLSTLRRVSTSTLDATARASSRGPDDYVSN